MKEWSAVLFLGLLGYSLFDWVFLQDNSEWQQLLQQPQISREQTTIKEWPRVLVYSIVFIAIELYYHATSLVFYTVICSYILIFFPYLMKSTRYVLCCMEDRRCHRDKLMYTSYVYFISSVVAFLWFQDYEYAFLCLITTIGSIIYHYFREARFFNFDNIFATVHFVVYSITLTDSYTSWDEYFLAGMVSFPIALFSLVYCGTPATISESSPTAVQRESRQIYDDWHMIWHLTSGVGPLLSLYYLHCHFQPRSFYDGQIVFDRFLVYCSSVTISMLFNLIANILHVIPLD